MPNDNELKKKKKEESPVSIDLTGQEEDEELLSLIETGEEEGTDKKPARLFEKEAAKREKMAEKESWYEEPSFEPSGYEKWRPPQPAATEAGSLDELVKNLADKIPKFYFATSKKRIVIVAAVIYVLFGAILTYLLFFNTGVVLRQEADEEGKNRIYVTNESVHAIRNIAISYLDPEGKKQNLTAFDFLLPTEKKEIDLSAMKFNQFDLIAEAPFHVVVVQRILLKDLRKASNIKSEIKAPSVGFVGWDYDITLKLCNGGGEEMTDVKVQQVHNTKFFAERPETKVFDLKAFGCVETAYRLKPLIAGETKIVFNIIAGDTPEKQELNVKIDQ